MSHRVHAAERYASALCWHAESFNYTSRQTGSTSGLQLGLNVDQANYTYASSASVGFRVSNIMLSLELNRRSRISSAFDFWIGVVEKRHAQRRVTFYESVTTYWKKQLMKVMFATNMPIPFSFSTQSAAFATFRHVIQFLSNTWTASSLKTPDFIPPLCGCSAVLI